MKYRSTHCWNLWWLCWVFPVATPFPPTLLLQSLPIIHRTCQCATRRQPIDSSGWPDRFPAKEHCSKCGLCETSTLVQYVTEACPFLGQGMARMDQLESVIHNRTRQDASSCMGVLHRPIQLAQGTLQDAQWTGCVTGIALSMLEAKMVDAVVCVAAAAADPNHNHFLAPEPMVARTAAEVLKGRGVKPALAPSLRVTQEVQEDPSIRRLLFCGVGCAVQAFRVIQSTLDTLEEVYVLGTNCADNSPTPEAAQRFLREGVQVEDSTILGYEFMQDFQVHVKTTNSYVTKPYFCLPGSIAQSSIAPSCLACFDYTNGLADVVVGYMGAPFSAANRMDESLQTVSIRNARGQTMVDTAVAADRLRLVGDASGNGKSHEALASATVASDAIVLDMLQQNVPESGMPLWLGKIMAFGLRSMGPTGLDFAKYSIDYHILRNYLHVLHEWGEERTKIAVPRYAQDIVDHYLAKDKAFAKIKEQIKSKKQ